MEPGANLALGRLLNNIAAAAALRVCRAVEEARPFGSVLRIVGSWPQPRAIRLC
jgi:hypothetical protein